MLKEAQKPVCVSKGILQYIWEIKVFNFLQLEKKCLGDKYIIFLKILLIP